MLALVVADDESRVRYVNVPSRRRGELFGVTSVNYNLAGTVGRAREPA